MKALKLTALLLATIALSSCAPKEKEKPLSATVVFLLGKAEIDRGSAGSPVAMKTGDVIAVTDTIRGLTAATAIDLQIGESSRLKVKGESELKMEKLSSVNGKDHATMQMALGKALVKPKKLQDGESFVISTPTAVAGVRGTSFVIETNADKKTVVTVTEGKVLMKKNLPSIEAASEENRNLSAILDQALEEAESGEVIEANQSAAVTEEEVQETTKVIEEMTQIVEEVKAEQVQTSGEATSKEIAAATQRKIDEKIVEKMELPPEILAAATLSPEQKAAAAPVFVFKPIEVKQAEPAAISEEDRKELEELKPLKMTEASPVTTPEEVTAPVEETKIVSVPVEIEVEKTTKAAVQSRVAFTGNSPAVSGNTILLASPRALFAFHTDSMKQKWSYSVPEGILSSPAIHDGRAYILSRNGVMHSIDIANGIAKWTANAEITAFDAKPVFLTGKMLLGFASGNVIAFDVKSGKQLWKKNLESAVYGSLSSSGTSIFLTTMNNTVWALDSSSGTEQWKHTPDNRMPGGKILYSNDKVVLSSFNNSVFALKTKSGKIAWEKKLSGTPVSHPVSADGNAIVATTDGSIYKLNANNGAIQWQKNIGTAIRIAPEVTQDSVYAAVDNTIFRLSLSSGDLVSQKELKSKITSGLAIDSSSQVYSVTGKGNLQRTGF